eukprot:scpid46334/ scgid20215/ 
MHRQNSRLPDYDSSEYMADGMPGAPVPRLQHRLSSGSLRDPGTWHDSEIHVQADEPNRRGRAEGEGDTCTDMVAVMQHHHGPRVREPGPGADGGEHNHPVPTAPAHDSETIRRTAMWVCLYAENSTMRPMSPHRSAAASTTVAASSSWSSFACAHSVSSYTTAAAASSLSFQSCRYCGSPASELCTCISSSCAGHAGTVATCADTRSSVSRTNSRRCRELSWSRISPATRCRSSRCTTHCSPCCNTCARSHNISHCRRPSHCRRSSCDSRSSCSSRSTCDSRSSYDSGSSWDSRSSCGSRSSHRTSHCCTRDFPCYRYRRRGGARKRSCSSMSAVTVRQHRQKRRRRQVRRRRTGKRKASHRHRHGRRHHSRHGNSSRQYQAGRDIGFDVFDRSGHFIYKNLKDACPYFRNIFPDEPFVSGRFTVPYLDTIQQTLAMLDHELRFLVIYRQHTDKRRRRGEKATCDYWYSTQLKQALKIVREAIERVKEDQDRYRMHLDASLQHSPHPLDLCGRQAPAAASGLGRDTHQPSYSHMNVATDRRGHGVLPQMPTSFQHRDDRALRLPAISTARPSVVNTSYTVTPSVTSTVPRAAAAYGRRESPQPLELPSISVFHQITASPRPHRNHIRPSYL